MMRCQCDACGESGHYAASDGFCEFCNERCFPPTSLGSRLSLSYESRTLLHQRQARRSEPPTMPAGEMVNAALQLIGDKRTRQRAEAAVYLARQLGPHVGPAAKFLIGRFLKRG